MSKVTIGRDEFKLISSKAGAEALHDLLGEPQDNRDFITALVLYTSVMTKLLVKLENSLFGDDSKDE